MFRVSAPLCLVAAALVASPAAASLIQLPHVAGRDGALAGNVVAAPDDGGSILYFNPAGAAGRPGTEGLFSLQLSNVTARYINRDTGYDGKSSENPLAPVIWAGSDVLDDWNVGVGLYGAVGAAFNLPGDEQSGIPGRLLGEFSTIHVGFVAGREILPGLRWGVQVAPTLGHLKAVTPTPLGVADFHAHGPGIVGSTGLLWDATETTTFGLAYRTPGIVWLSGDGDVGETDTDVDVEFRTPQNVTFGFAHRVTDALTVLGQARWTRYSEFEDADLEFDAVSALDQPLIPDARDVFRWGLALEYQALENLVLRTGYTREDYMVEESSLRPTLFDTSDDMVMAGFGATFDRWTIDFQTGYLVTDDRVATEEENPFFPGRYKFEAVVAVGVAVTRRFDTATFFGS